MKYELLFVWIGAFALIASSASAGFYTEFNGYRQHKTKRVYANIAFIPIIYFVVTSTWQYWGDYSLYLNNYVLFPTDISQAASVIIQQEDSWLFYAFTYLVKVLSGGNLLAYRLALSLMQSIPIVVMLRRYSGNYAFSVFLFLTAAVPMAWMLNGVRQLCAAAIIYGSTHLYVERKYFKTVLLILFAACFHQSAILMLPMVFISLGKAWNKWTLLCIAGAIVFVSFSASLSGSYNAVMSNIGYDMSSYVNDDGVHPLRVLVNVIPVLLAFLARRKIEEEDSPAINFFVNMALLNFGIYLVGMATSGILIGRVPLYTSMYNFILMPYLIEKLYRGGIRKLMYIAAAAGYFLYYFAQY